MQKSQQEIEIEYIKDCEIAEKNTILRVVAGSRAYGTQLPDSDYDERGIFIDIPQRVCLPFEEMTQIKLPKDDIVLYELSKYMHLLTSQSPNIMELIWTEPEDIKFSNKAGKILLENRALFLTQDVGNTYSGFAMGQLAQIRSKNKWINNPQPKEVPEQKDFITLIYNMTSNSNLNKVNEINHNQYKALKLKDGVIALFNKENLSLDDKSKGWIDRLGNPIFSTSAEINNYINDKSIKPDLLLKLNKETWMEATKNHKEYWSWKSKINENNGKSETENGYETKNAMHLIRLLKSGIDILEHGVVPVRRKDAQELLDIRAGKFTYEEIISEVKRLEENLRNSAKKSNLPKTLDMGFIKDITFEMYKQHWTENNFFATPIESANNISDKNNKSRRP